MHYSFWYVPGLTSPMWIAVVAVLHVYAAVYVVVGSILLALQNVELAPYADLAKRPVDLQTSALIVFMAMFIAGVGLIAWMVSKAVEANRRSSLGIGT